jgi:hypothetical protein
MPHINLVAQGANNKPPVVEKSLGQRVTMNVKWPRVIPYLIHEVTGGYADDAEPYIVGIRKTHIENSGGDPIDG